MRDHQATRRLIRQSSYSDGLWNVIQETGLSLSMAKEVIGARLGSPGKMPCYTFGQDAFQCQRGDELSKLDGSVCSDCYARKNFYKTWKPVKQNRERHQANIYHPRWVDAMVVLVTKATEDVPYFRWFDSVDLESAQQLQNIAAVCMATPHVNHWLATREWGYVNDYIEEEIDPLWHEDPFPPNLALRVSADFVEQSPPTGPWLTSTVNLAPGAPVQVSASRKDSIECKAYTREMKCGPCRACWSRDVPNVSYWLHV